MSFIELIVANLPAGMTAVYLMLLAIVFLRRRGESSTYGVMAFLGASAAWQLSFFLFPVSENRFVAPITSGLWVLAFFMLLLATLRYLDRPLSRGLLPAGLTLITALTILGYAWPTLLFTALPIQIVLAPNLGNILVGIMWVVVVLACLGMAWHAYQQTPYPWHANRYLYWGTMALFIAAGDGALLWNNLTFVALGHTLRFMGAAGVVYGVIAYVQFDVRTRFLNLLAFSIIALSSALPATLVILVIIYLHERFTTTQLNALIAIVTSSAFLFYLPYRRFLERLIFRYFLGTDLQTGKIIRSFTQSIARTLDVEQLAYVTVGSLSELFGTTRGAMILVSKSTQGYELEPIPAMGQIDRQKQQLLLTSPFLTTLTLYGQPILQYEIEFNPTYQEIKQEVNSWFKNMGMEVYAPIRAGQELIGCIVIGPKSNNLTYRANELDVIQLMADQMVAPLQNARLYGTLGEQNQEVRRLNEDLVSQNERLELMDRVKSDFITIASHELRTPLTQVKGYADILSAMNEENALTREQTRQIINHINRAALQLEKLITAMLDASQIDVDEMQMTFMSTQLDTVIRLSIEPLTKALRERRLKIIQRGIDDLPPIHADFKRLVQAFTNLVGNAVKYTPDGGTITIKGKYHEEAGGFVEVAIIDTGIGIDVKYHQLIFEKFFRIGDPQLHSTGSTKFMGAGPGLGLPIAKGVIEGHGGRIWVESEGEDKERFPGSTFSVVLPIRPPKMPDLDEIKQNPSQAPAGERPPWLVG